MRYLHSLDPVLFTEQAGPTTTHDVVVGIQMRLSVLLGFQLSVSEPQGFISLARFSDTKALTEAWSSVEPATEPGARPIVFGIQARHSSLADACAAALTDEKYKLPWAPPNIADRQHLGELIRLRKFGEAAKSFGWLENELANVASLDRYSSVESRQVEPIPRGDSLGALLRVARAKAESSGSTPDSPDSLLAGLLGRMFAAEIPTGSRSRVLKYISETAKDSLALDAERLVNELYNQVEAFCLRAENEIAGTAVISGDADDWVAELAEDVRSSTSAMVTDEALYEIVPEPARFLRTVSWADVREIVRDPEWRNSVVRLSECETKRSQEPNRYDENMHRHIDEVLAPRLARHHWAIKHVDQGADVFIKSLAHPLAPLVALHLAWPNPSSNDQLLATVMGTMASAFVQRVRGIGPELDAPIMRRHVARQIKKAARLAPRRVQPR